MIRKGTEVTWKWGNGTAEGKGKPTYSKETTRTKKERSRTERIKQKNTQSN